MTGPAFLQGTQDTAKPNVPKKKFQGRARSASKPSVAEAEENMNRQQSAEARGREFHENYDPKTRQVADPKNSPDETDDDNEAKSIGELLADTVKKKKFAGKPKEKK